MRSEIFLDNAATTQVDPKVADRIYQFMINEYGNPSSLHPKGLAAEAAVRSARLDIAAALGVESKYILFTSGGTEANNTAIYAACHSLQAKGGKILCSSIEHPSIIAPLKSLGNLFSVEFINVDSTGVIDLNHLQNLATNDVQFLCLMAVNNEVGSIQPILQAIEIVKKANPLALVLVDAVQAFGNIDLKAMIGKVDFLSLSAHKIHGPKGIGILYNRLEQKLKPLIYGGGQERGLRSGTENVPGIVGMQEAVNLIVKEPYQQRLYMLKEMFYTKIMDLIPDTRLNGPLIQQGAPHIINLSFSKIKGEVLVRLLGDKGVYISTGSACSSRKKGSHVLTAMGIPERQIDGSVRISFSKFSTPAELETAADILARSVKDLRAWS